ncbi:hypothetical protein PAXRUDRAFT_15731 [Paxillus rubicundulus Ve08.2h10]|uniref:Unplaced genomic scaffold scaffold_1172, whole genome shotgun sequence n=1 Tax=Paxillus rubicundulus Ve08.2h10 TaxID=930991 RepID=A0A0D0DGU7_9AGAM|nr:hypothetical protein PAXRUDRAFT_15731 [Paxillus rubicundulus Ve08.2h10]
MKGGGRKALTTGRRVDEEEDNLGVLVEVIVGFSVQIAMQTLAKAYVEGRVVRQGGSDSGVRVNKPKREGLGSRTKTDPKGKVKEVDEDDDMEVTGEKEDDRDEDEDVDADADTDREVESLV